MANNDNELTTRYKWHRKAPLPQLRAPPQPPPRSAKAAEEVPKDPYNVDRNYANVSGHSLLRQPVLPLKVPGLNPDTLITMGLFQNETEKPTVVGPANKRHKRKDGFEYAWIKSEGQQAHASETKVNRGGMDNHRKSIGTNTQGGSRYSRDSGSSRPKSRSSNGEGRSHGSRSSGSHGRSGSYGGESGSQRRGSKGGDSNGDDVPAGASAHQHHHHRHQESHHNILDLDDSSEDAEKKHKQHSHSSSNNRHHHHRHHHRRSSGGSSKRR